MKRPILPTILLVLGLVLAACDPAPASRPGETIVTPAAPAPDEPETIDELVEEAEEAGVEIVEVEDIEPDVPAQEIIEPDETTPAAAPADGVPSFAPGTHTLQLETIAEGFSQPLYVDHAGDDSRRIFVVEKTGAIQIVLDGIRLEPAFLDIADRVNSSGFEQGLLGSAFPPDFAETGYFFVNYTDASNNTVVSRFQVDPTNPNLADPDSEVEILYISQPAANHNGGGLKFGPDGYLWIGTGDGGGAGDRFEQGQDPTTLLGKMLRIDVTSDLDAPYLIPEDNPWLEGEFEGQEVRDEIWAVGLRNPWRYSFDRATGDLWIADVGQSAIEAIHMTPADHPGGLNYGWPILEGSLCYREPNECDTTGLELPVLEYAHGQGDCSITGGYIYRGQTFSDLQGAYIFGDYCSGNMWVGVPDGNGTWISHHALNTGMQISSFGEDEVGELYVTGLNDGVLYRVILE